jgi:hypothetical protein
MLTVLWLPAECSRLNANGNADDAEWMLMSNDRLRGKTVIGYERRKYAGSLGIAAKRCSNDTGGSKLRGVVARGNVLLGRLPKGDPRRTVPWPSCPKDMTGECSEGLGNVEAAFINGLFWVWALEDNGRRRAPSTISPRLKPRLLTRRWLDSAGAPKSSSTKLLPRLRALSSKLLLRARRLNTLDMGRGVCS